MNRVFRIVWSRTLNAWVVASELTGRHGKGRGRPGASGADTREPSSRSGVGAWALRASVLTALAALYAPQALAVDRYWDINGTGTGTGTWDLSSPYWNSASDGVTGPMVAWNNAGLDNAYFGGTAGTVTLGTPITANALIFNTTGYTLSGGTLTLAGTTPTITVNTGTDTIGSVIAGTAGLTKSGAGTLLLSGANTFSGGITVNTGT